MIDATTNPLLERMARRYVVRLSTNVELFLAGEISIEELHLRQGHQWGLIHSRHEIHDLVLRLLRREHGTTLPPFTVSAG